ncbi:hypothetical protein CO038_00405 [Candidatus Pacearchaeota archaeon CG_4_9_14_0_2_um_filter_39_13]|nr:hypothetical protein [Candidatus Pacearchaeota archaeon]OIO42834.1 MAG: hypothetical protein AUJ64_03535 [Candidatus Pacearchaeota archaeon CG1_02_39_14]PJC45082.1 MAG: hypothetical protein CO038_00405 [Candidatus Pacearchaeota archaeon CG_4_9_14_0_2_um_filter_39_13]
MNEFALNHRLVSWDLSHKVTYVTGITEFLALGYLTYDKIPLDSTPAKLALSVLAPTAGYAIPVVKSVVRAPYKLAGDIISSILETVIITGNRAIETGKKVQRKILGNRNKTNNQSAINLEERVD